MHRIKVIEMIGVPGAGKSTLYDQVVKEMNGKDSFIPRSYYLKFISSEWTLLIYKTLVKINPFMKHFMKAVKEVSKISEQARDFSIYSLVAFYDLTKWFRLLFPNRIVLLDEGFLQNITSLYHQVRITDSPALKELMEMIFSSFELVPIVCRISEETAFQRIRKRERMDRIGIMNDEELRGFLKIKKENIDFLVSKHQTNYCFDMEAGKDVDRVNRFIQIINKEMMR